MIDLSDEEKAFMLAACTDVAGRTGRHLREAGYPVPSEDDRSSMSEIIQDAIIHIILGTRTPGWQEPPDFSGVLDAMLEGIAQGVILRVIGQPPGTPTGN